LLVDDNVGCSRRNALFRNIHAVPRQSEQFTNAQRAGKRQIQAQLPATSRLKKKKCRAPTETRAKASAYVPSVPTAADVLIFSGALCLTTAEPALH
jgi:hypothetical protein